MFVDRWMLSHTLSGRVLAPRSRSGSLNLRLLPSILILRVTSVSGVGAVMDAMMEIHKSVEGDGCQ